MEFRLPTGSFPFGISKKANKLSCPYRRVMAHPLVGWIAAIARAGAQTRRHFHGMNERHTEHIDIEVDRRLHVVGAECEVMNAAQGRCHERVSHVFTHAIHQFRDSGGPGAALAQCLRCRGPGFRGDALFGRFLTSVAKQWPSGSDPGCLPFRGQKGCRGRSLTRVIKARQVACRPFLVSEGRARCSTVLRQRSPISALPELDYGRGQVSGSGRQLLQPVLRSEQGVQAHLG